MLFFSKALWGRPLGLRPTPSSAFGSRLDEQPDQRVRRGRGRPPHGILLISVALCTSLPAADVHIGVFSLFRPVELRVSPVKTPILITTGDQHLTLEGHRSYLVRLHDVPFRVTGRNGSPTNFRLSIPGKIDRRFYGILNITSNERKLRPVITLDLELAVASVVAAELTASTPMEALKAQAVAARSFFAASGPRHDDFEFCDTTHCQFLREPPTQGTPAVRAAHDTSGLLLAYDGKPLPALYSAACGGRTRSLDEPKTGYSYRAVDCDYCRRHNPGQVQGHQLGLCQSGAAAMAASGADFRAILDHYYPGASIEQIAPRTGTAIFLLPHPAPLSHIK